MRNKGTWVTVFFVVATGLVAMVLDLALSDVFAYLRVQDTPILGENFTLSTLIACSTALLVAIYAGMVNKRASILVGECAEELNKSAWPTWSETKMNTLTVVVTSFVAAIILGLFDSVFSWLTRNNLFLG